MADNLREHARNPEFMEPANRSECGETIGRAAKTDLRRGLTHESITFSGRDETRLYFAGFGQLLRSHAGYDNRHRKGAASCAARNAGQDLAGRKNGRLQS